MTENLCASLYLNIEAHRHTHTHQCQTALKDLMWRDLTKLLCDSLTWSSWYCHFQSLIMNAANIVTETTEIQYDV